jgi:Cu2+-containing amine oxidase
MRMLRLARSVTGRWCAHVCAGAVVGSMFTSGLGAQAPLDPLSPGEEALAKNLFLQAPGVQEKLGGNKDRFRIVSVERHEQPKDVALTAERAANVVAYDYTTNSAISAVVRLNSNQVGNVVATSGAQPSLSEDELAEARQLALANESVQARLSSAGAAGDTDSLIVTHLLVKDESPQSACAVHRCVMLFFNTKEAAVNVTPIVDLSARNVQVR